MSSTLIGDYLFLERDIKNPDPRAVKPAIKIKIVAVEGSFGITDKGVKIPTADLFDEILYVKQDFSTVDLGMGKQFTSENIENPIGVENRPAMTTEPVFVNPVNHTPQYQQGESEIKRYTEHQSFVDSAIQIAKKQGKSFTHQIIIDVTVPFDMSFIQTTAVALNVPFNDIVKVLSDNVEIDSKSIKQSLIADILGVNPLDIITHEEIAESLQESVEELPKEIEYGTAVVTVLSEYLGDPVKIVVDLSGERQEVLDFDDIILQQFLIDTNVYSQVIDKIIMLCQEIPDHNSITFNFKEELYTTMLEKIKAEYQTSIDNPTVHVDEVVTESVDEQKPEIDLTEIENAKERTKNLPKIGNSLLDIWNLRKPK